MASHGFAPLGRRLFAEFVGTGLLVTVVVLSAVVPTAVAERWFLPDSDRERRIDRRLAASQSEEYV